MADIEFKYDKVAWKKFINRIEKKVSKDTQDRILKSTAFNEGLSTFIRATGKWRSIRNQWKVLAESSGYKIVNTNKVAGFLEKGTGLHGPMHRIITPKKKKWLYIPLRRSAAIWRPGLVIGKDYILAKESKGMSAQPFFDDAKKTVFKAFVKNFLTELRKK